MRLYTVTGNLAARRTCFLAIALLSSLSLLQCPCVCNVSATQVGANWHTDQNAADHFRGLVPVYKLVRASQLDLTPQNLTQRAADLAVKAKTLDPLQKQQYNILVQLAWQINNKFEDIR